MRNRPYGFEIYLVNVKTIRTIARIFVANVKIIQVNHFQEVPFFQRIRPEIVQESTAMKINW